ncbi:hypothetical protein OHA21_43635 [Actinoplanes sp. NBC_00393]|uniref:hypothetical protein n=1 Tax=Actinoplanes sp. NBC_00393 TaxID=2975953 RepID=UPI002E1FF4CD
MTVIDLFPTAWRRTWGEIERVCEHLDEVGLEPFSVQTVCDVIDGPRLRGHGRAFKQVVRSYMALGWVERITPVSRVPRPVFYRVLPHAASPCAGTGSTA